MEMKHKVFNLIILDESGSMASIKNSIINGFNEVVQTVKAVQIQFPEQEHFISLVSFNGLGIKTLLEMESVDLLKEIDETKYQPASMTPLYDAMGFSLEKLRRDVEKLNDYNVLVTILTDGEENSSKEFTAIAIKIFVEELKAKGWTFTYIGSEHNVKGFASSISITNTMFFEKNSKDIKRMFEREKLSRMNYSEKIRNNEDVQEDFYKDNPVKENK